jgi:hypothetical protein
VTRGSATGRTVADTLVRTADGKAHRSHRVKIRGEAARELRLDLLRHPWVGSQDVRHQVAEHHTRVAVHSVRIQHPRLPRSHHTISRSFHTEMQKLRIVTIGLAPGDRKWSLNDGQIPNFRGVRVHVSTGYNRVEGNRWALRNGLVSDLPPEIPHVTIRNFCMSATTPTGPTHNNHNRAHTTTHGVVYTRAALQFKPN